MIYPNFSPLNIILLGLGSLLGGILSIIAIKKDMIPPYPIKWGIAITGIIVGIILMVIGALLNNN